MAVRETVLHRTGLNSNRNQFPRARSVIVFAVAVFLPSKLAWDLKVNAFGLLAVIAIAGILAVTAAWAAGRRLRPFALSAVIFATSFLLMPATISIATGKYPRAEFDGVKFSEPAGASTWMTITIICVAIAATSFGYATNGSAFLQVDFRLRRNADVVAFLLASSALLAGTLLYGFPGPLFDSRQARSAVLSSAFQDTGLATIIDGAIRSGPLVAALYIIWHRRFRMSTIGALSLVIGSIGIVLYSNPISSARQWAGPVLLGVAVAAMGPRHIRRFIGPAIIAYVVGVMALFPSVGGFRSSKAPVELKTELTDVYLTADYDQFTVIAGATGLVKDSGFGMGENLLSTAFFWLPRAFWSTKAETANIAIANHMNQQFTNLSSPLPVEGYLDFGLVGVVGICLIAGILLRLGDRLFESSFQSQPAKSILPSLAFLAAFTVIFLRGPLRYSAINLAVFGLLSILLFRPRLGINTPAPGLGRAEQ